MVLEIILTNLKLLVLPLLTLCRFAASRFSLNFVFTKKLIQRRALIRLWRVVLY